MPRHAICAEIGAWKGDFSERILSITKPRKLYLIDPYKYVPAYANAWYGNHAMSQETMDEIYDSVVLRFADELKTGKMEIIRNSSKPALQDFADGSFDWIYIDGNHTYEFVREDLLNSWMKVKPGGFITGDDYHLEGWWEDGVTKAVDEFVSDNQQGISEFTCRQTQFIIRKAEALK
jgi:hypothetical protein